jgi:hypothetical protein
VACRLPRLTRLRCQVALGLVFGLAFGSLSARAESRQEAAAKKHANRGARQFEIGNFQSALTEFQLAHDLDPAAPILLYDIAQTYRALEAKEQAVTFYRKYLDAAPETKYRAEVEKRIQELSASVKTTDKTQTQTTSPIVEQGVPPTPPIQTASAHGSPNPALAATSSPPPVNPPSKGGETPRWSIAGYVAPSVILLSTKKDFDLPVLFAARLGVSYTPPFAGDRLRLRCDAVLSFLPYRDTVPPGNTSFLGLLIGASYLYPIDDRFSVGGGLGVGSIWWAGLAAGNPFTVDSVAASGAIPMPTLQVEIRGEYRLWKDIFLLFAPQLLMSATTSAGLSDSVSAVTRIDIDIGAGYVF